MCPIPILVEQVTSNFEYWKELGIELEKKSGKETDTSSNSQVSTVHVRNSIHYISIVENDLKGTIHVT